MAEMYDPCPQHPDADRFHGCDVEEPPVPYYAGDPVRMGEPERCAVCRHAAAEHRSEPALDGRTGCRAAIGSERCPCLWQYVG